MSSQSSNHDDGSLPPNDPAAKRRKVEGLNEPPPDQTVMAATDAVAHEDRATPGTAMAARAAIVGQEARAAVAAVREAQQRDERDAQDFYEDQAARTAISFPSGRRLRLNEDGFPVFDDDHASTSSENIENIFEKDKEAKEEPKEEPTHPEPHANPFQALTLMLDKYGGPANIRARLQIPPSSAIQAFTKYERPTIKFGMRTTQTKVHYLEGAMIVEEAPMIVEEAIITDGAVITIDESPR
jgi:hypothetical protein